MRNEKGRRFEMLFRQVRSAAIAGILSLGAVGAAFMILSVEPAFARSAPASFADLAERLSPAVVNISTSQTIDRSRRRGVPDMPEGSPFEELFRDFFDQRRDGPPPRSTQSLGSGFVISADGYVVTNNHVIAGADEIEVNFIDGSSLEAVLIGADPKTDIAVLKVDSDRQLDFVPFGDSDAARVGDWVLAIGNPFGLGGSVSAGIISARNRNINAGPYDDFIQTDAAINRGNSGGPLFNMDGAVIGVNTAIISPSGGSIGIGFAVPAQIAKNVVRQLRDYGRTRRGWLGVKIQTVDEPLAESLGMARARGALVAGVDENGPAQAAGILVGDVIVGFNGKSIEVMHDLPRIVAATPVDETVPVEVLRRGKIEVLDVTIALLAEGDDAVKASLSRDEPAKPGVTALGMRFESLDSSKRRRYNIEDHVKGIVITEIDDAGSAYERGIRIGDVVVQVSQRDVGSPKEVEDEIENATEEGRRSVLFMINRGGELRFIAVDYDN
jgi:serine protease Do